jgi:hypothetical protein
MCHLKFPGENCTRGRGICTATAEEACMAGKVFKSESWDKEAKTGKRKQDVWALGVGFWLL